jgi:hypothetical protein
MIPRHGGVIFTMPDAPTPATTLPLIPQKDNFTPAPAIPPEDGTIKPVSIVPVVFAGLVLLFILSNKNSQIGLNFNLR